MITLTIILVLLMLIDVITQSLHLRTSNNLLRFLTGSLVGIICGIDIYYIIDNFLLRV